MPAAQQQTKRQAKRLAVRIIPAYSKHLTLEERFWGKVVKTADCWIWVSTLSPKGYGVFNLDQSKRRCGPSQIRAHRMSYILAKGAIPDGLLVCHSCDNPRCVRPEHLFIGTNKDNMDDRNNKGRHTKGESHHSAKLTAEIVLEMRRRHAAGESSASLSRQFGVAAPVGWEAIHRRTWRHLPG